MTDSQTLDRYDALAIRALGGPVKAARVLSVKDDRYQTVQSWLANRVPSEYCPEIEKATDGQFVCELLRPDIAWFRVQDANWKWHRSGRPTVDITRCEPVGV